MSRRVRRHAPRNKLALRATDEMGSNACGTSDLWHLTLPTEWTACYQAHTIGPSNLSIQLRYSSHARESCAHGMIIIIHDIIRYLNSNN